MLPKSSFVKWASQQPHLETMVTSLSELFLPKRIARLDEILGARMRSVSVAVENPINLHNVWALVRTAETFGVFIVHLITPEAQGSTGKRTSSKGSHGWIDLCQHKTLEEFMEYAGRTNVRLAGAVAAAPKEASPLAGDFGVDFPVESPLDFLAGKQSFEDSLSGTVGLKASTVQALKKAQRGMSSPKTSHWVDASAVRPPAEGGLKEVLPLDKIPLDHPVCLVFGNEIRGLSPQAVRSCEHLFTIPMYGMTESLNLSVSAAISLYETLRRKRMLLGRPGDLTTEQLQVEKGWLLYNAIAKRSGERSANTLIGFKDPL